jgi:hypothetical protein
MYLNKYLRITSVSQNKIAVAFRWLARVIGLIAAVYFLFWYVFFDIGSGLVDHIPINADIISPIVFGALVLLAYILSWWRERLGGILFILSAIGVFIVPAMISTINAKLVWNGSFSLFVRNWPYLALPLLAAGVLFLFTAWLSRRHQA